MWNRLQSKFESVGVQVMRYGLAAILLLIGLAKFTQEEAMGIQSLVAHSPFMWWMYSIWSTARVSRIIGVIELATAVLIASYPLSRRASLIGSFAAVATFLLTSSFLLSTPGAVQWGGGISILGPAGQFLIKDLVLLGTSIYLAGQASRERAGDCAEGTCLR